MEKIDLYVKNMWENIKINGTRVKLKPFIGTKDMVGIVSVCVNQFDLTERDVDQIPLIKTIFDMMVVYYCTNIRVKGIVVKKDGKKENISIDVSDDDVESFDNSQAILHIKPYIKNYNECFSLLLKTLEMRNVYQSLVGFSMNLPDEETMITGLKTSLEAMQQVKEKDPETFDKIVKEVATQNIREAAQKETKSKKKAK